MNPNAKRKRGILRVIEVIAAIVLSPLWVPLLTIWLLYYVFTTVFIYLAIWLLWLRRGKRILFVYSDSPIWHDYIEQHILPLIHEHAVVLNWSHRRSRSWSRSFLAVAAFKHFGGWNEFNPIAVVFRPFRRAKIFRFLPAFRDYKHGKSKTLAAIQREFFEYSSLHSTQPNT